MTLEDGLRASACSHAGLSSQPLFQDLHLKEMFCPDKSAHVLTLSVLWKVNITQSCDHPLSSQFSFLNSELVLASGTLNLCWGESRGVERQQSSSKASIHCLIYNKLGYSPLRRKKDTWCNSYFLRSQRFPD